MSDTNTFYPWMLLMPNTHTFYPYGRVTTDLPGEVWEPIFKVSKYYVSNYGRIKSFNSGRTARILQQRVTNDIVLVELHWKSHKGLYSVADLVAKAFLYTGDRKYTYLHHRDGNVKNNRVENLKLV